MVVPMKVEPYPESDYYERDFHSTTQWPHEHRAAVREMLAEADRQVDIKRHAPDPDLMLIRDPSGGGCNCMKSVSRRALIDQAVRNIRARHPKGWRHILHDRYVSCVAVNAIRAEFARLSNEQG